MLIFRCFWLSLKLTHERVIVILLLKRWAFLQLVLLLTKVALLKLLSCSFFKVVTQAEFLFNKMQKSLLFPDFFDNVQSVGAGIFLETRRDDLSQKLHFDGVPFGLMYKSEGGL